jgi:nitrous-oxide reductase
MPIPLGEPHYVVAIDTNLLKPIVRYPAGTNSRTEEISPFKTKPGEEKIVRTGNKVEVFGTLIRSHITPEIIEVDQGNEVSIHLTNLERAEDQTHGFTISKYNVNGSWEPGKTASVSFKADTPGVFPYYCTEFCSALHLEMQGYLLVKPKGYKAAAATGKETGQQYTKADYEKQMEAIKNTQKAIDDVVTYLKANGYEKFPTVKAQVEDALEQLGRADPAKAKTEEFAAKQDWTNAMLWANQWWQYQVKCADVGLRAKDELNGRLGKQPQDQ